QVTYLKVLMIESRGLRSNLIGFDRSKSLKLRRALFVKDQFVVGEFERPAGDVDDPAAGNTDEQTQGHVVRHQRAAALAHEGQRDAGDRGEADGHADVDGGLNENERAE